MADTSVFSSPEAMQTAPDRELIGMAHSGQTEATAVLVQRYAPMLQKEVNRFGNPGVPREDLEQEGFLGLLSAIRTFRTEQTDAAFSTYAYTCIRNRILSALRRSKAHDQREELPEDAIPDVPDTEADPALLVQQRDEAARLSALLTQELSPLEYQVFRLYLQQFSYGEIASRLSVPVKTVDNSLQRARRKLGRCLQDTFS